ncbi:MAG TPA: carboxylating nicotinate-nucleotide diphosphorylase [Chryseolinea sp.]|nr:carboxylating nicotinate-nucleotide diphosphorylase [Chryseolinea sp.]HPH46564.1 carboxylating nicotinate-nucleotide diphosphorylase [Chryseolinea sp.]HPM31338.1 carboxylating nicotinate-nucleotide diphosphorylase [Chryseolinea sp.]
MKPDYITDEFLDRFISAAMAEDVGDGDHSSLASIPEETKSRAHLLVKDNGILAGVALAEKIFHHVDNDLIVKILLTDGAGIKKGDIAFTVEGSAQSILTSERLVLNCMQRMSAIATKTNYLTSLIAGTHTKLLDTRKTTPNFRLLEKWAVRIGGGKNHRIGLFDMIMLKDNHIDMAGGIEQAIFRTKDYLRATNRSLRIEIETRNLQEVKEVLKIGGIDIIMLDNMNLADMKEAVKLIDGKFTTEASGGITEATIKGVAECGVDFISVGALTHSVASLDLSLKAY